MKIPKSINVFGNKVKVKRVDLVAHDYSGLYVPHEKVILLDSSLKGKELKQVFYHEVGHAIFDALGLNVTSISADAQEIIVDGFARFWVSR